MKFTSVTIIVGTTNEKDSLITTVDTIMDTCNADDIDKILLVKSKDASDNCNYAIALLEEKYKGKLIYWVLSNLLTNVLARPDFIAYNHRDADMFSRKVCSLLGALPVAYTIKSQKEYEKAKDQFELFIFDSFILE